VSYVRLLRWRSLHDDLCRASRESYISHPEEAIEIKMPVKIHLWKIYDSQAR